MQEYEYKLPDLIIDQALKLKYWAFSTIAN